MSSEKGRRFSHLRWKDRLKIERMLKEGHKVKEIAAALHVDSTTKKSSKKCRTFSTNYSALFCAFWAARKGHPPKSRR